jgi:hypothetical protein
MLDPPSKATTITLTNDTALAAGCRGVYVGTAGNLKVDMRMGEAGVVFANLPVGKHGMEISKIYSTANGTSASNILALY